MDSVSNEYANRSHVSPLLISELALHFEGKLLRRDELLIELTEETIESLLSLNTLTQIESITKKTFLYHCNRCGNSKQSLFAAIPCQACEEHTVYCRKCIDMGQVKKCEPLYYWSGEQIQWPNISHPCTWEGRLTPQQHQAAREITKAIVNNETLLVWAVTGSGKTEMLFPGLTEALQRGKRICIATPRTDVVRELLPRLQKAFKTISIQALYGGSRDRKGTAQLLIATTHQLIRYKRAFDVLIIDEIDAFPFQSDPTLPYVAKRAKRKQSATIYLTATPSEKQARHIRFNQLKHVFVSSRYHGNPLPIPHFKISFSLQSQLNKLNPPSPLIKWLTVRKKPNRQLILFVPTVKLAENLQSSLTDQFIQMDIITSKHELLTVHADDSEREEKVRLFREKKASVIVTTTILERGVTFPAVDVVVLDAGHHVFNEAALIQIAGRAGRSIQDPAGEVVFIHDGKTHAMIKARQTIKAMNNRSLKLKK